MENDGGYAVATSAEFDHGAGPLTRCPVFVRDSPLEWSYPTSWTPTHLVQVGASVATSTAATEVETDAGRAFIKVMGNAEGTHVLAADWVGTHLAKWFGLSTFDTAILPLDATDVFPLPCGLMAQPSPAFATRAVGGDAWGAEANLLDILVNPEDITRLVVFDTWTRNCDRFDGKPGGRAPNYGNVFLMTDGQESGRAKLMAMDHGLCFIRSGQELSGSLSNIDVVKDDIVYGLFPQFKPRLREEVVSACVSRLREMERPTAETLIATVPTEWEVSPAARGAWAESVWRRAGYIADTIRASLNRECPWFGIDGAN